MSRAIAKSLLCITLAVFLSLTTGLARAEDPYTSQSPSAEAMIADAVLLRPLGLVATAVGTAAFIVSLPFSLPSGNVSEAAQKLVVEPARYTFTRPLGHTETRY